MRKDHIAEQTFYQGITTHKNRYDFPTLADVIDRCIPTSCRSRRAGLLEVDRDGEASSSDL